MRRIRALLLAAAALAGCGTNPVTGERELQLVSAEQEASIGAANYLPSRQMQGGDYVVDAGVAAYVREVGARLAQASDRALPYEFVVVNNSLPNAWALPGGKIAVNRGLLTELGSEAELAAVLGHEIVHAAARHGAKSMERGLLMQGALAALSLSADDNRYSSLIVGGAMVGAQLVTLKYGRDAELEADSYGMRYMDRAGYDPLAAVTLQETFVRLSEGGQAGWLAGLFASHPPSAERVAANRATAAGLGGEGERGTQRYLAAIGPLLDSKEAYANFDRALKAFDEEDFKSARALVHEAVRAEPREARFRALLGDLEARARRDDEAVRAYDRSIALNPEYFQSYLGRGLVRERRGALNLAAADLERSIELLPTAVAHNALGQIEERRGNLDAAAEHFRIASSSASDSGRAAALSLARIELPRNPGAYLQAAADVDARGQVVVVVANRSGVPVRAVEVEVGLLDPTGRALVERRTVVVRETLAPGARTALPTGLGPITERAQLARVRVAVRAARLAE
jgi:predicted Zn-dependent protease